MSGFFRGNAIIGLAEVLCRLPLIFTAGYLARSVGASVYGNWALILFFQGVVASLAGLGLSSSLSRLSPSAEPARARAMFGFAIRTGTLTLALVAPLVLLFRDSLARLVGVQDALAPILVLVLLLSLAGMAEGMLDAYLKAREQVFRQVTFILMRSAAEIIAVLSVFGLVAAHAQLEVVDLLGWYVVVLFAGKALAYPWLLAGHRSAETSLSRADRKQFLHYGLPMIPVVVISLYVMQGDRLILGHLVEKRDLGAYAFAATLASYLVFLGYAVYPLLLSKASRLYDSDRPVEVTRIFREAQTMYFALVLAALAGLALFAAEIIYFTAGPKFADAAPLLVVLGLAVGMEHLFGVYQYVFHVVKRPHFVLVSVALNAGLMSAAVYLSATFGGIEMVPWALLVAVLVGNAVRYGMARFLLRVDLPAAIAVGALMLPGGIWALYVVTNGMAFLLRLIAFVIVLVCVSPLVLRTVRQVETSPVAG